jgi:endo-1,4-beta-mannosidase
MQTVCSFLKRLNGVCHLNKKGCPGAPKQPNNLKMLTTNQLTELSFPYKFQIDSATNITL